MSELFEALPYVGGIVLVVLAGGWIDELGDRIRGRKGTR